MPKQNSYPSLYRSEENKIIGGVCGGLGEYFKIDPNLIRLIFILLAVFGGSGLIIYLVLWIILPLKDSSQNKDHVEENLKEVKEKVREFAHNIGISKKEINKEQNYEKSNLRDLTAYAAILLGIIFLLNNFGLGNFINIDRLWPLLLILLGIGLILRR